MRLTGRCGFRGDKPCANPIDDDGVSRRKVLECMTWVGTGVLWTVSGGVPHSLGIMGEAAARRSARA